MMRDWSVLIDENPPASESGAMRARMWRIDGVMMKCELWKIAPSPFT